MCVWHFLFSASSSSWLAALAKQTAMTKGKTKKNGEKFLSTIKLRVCTDPSIEKQTEILFEKDKKKLNKPETTFRPYGPGDDKKQNFPRYYDVTG